ncbi:MAG: PEP-CTERM sorting domain-containing protein [Planctomycetota bacterium]
MSGGARIVLVTLVLLAASVPASAAILEIGGLGAVSTSDPPYGDLGLLDQGEVATATFGYVVVPTATGATLTLTVTNTSPAVTGTESPVIPDSPVISDIFFSVPEIVASMTFVSASGTPGASSGWDFSYDPDGNPSSGFGFLNSVFDVGAEGGPGPGEPDPVIGSIYDPDLTDSPGDPIASPVDFVFDLTFVGGVYPVGFSGDWFCDQVVLGYPDYIAAAKFISGADGGSGTVTNYVPEPATVVGLIGGMLGIAALRKKRK